MIRGVSILVSRHLRESENRKPAYHAVVMRLPPVVLTPGDATLLRRRRLREPRRRDGVQLLMLPPVRHHLVRVRADEIALDAVEVRRLVRGAPRPGLPLLLLIRTARPVARHVGPVLRKVPTHERVQALVPRRVLHEARLVAERVTAIAARAMEVGLVLPVAAVRVPAVLVEPGS